MLSDIVNWARTSKKDLSSVLLDWNRKVGSIFKAFPFRYILDLFLSFRTMMILNSGLSLTDFKSRKSAVFMKSETKWDRKKVSPAAEWPRTHVFFLALQADGWATFRRFQKKRKQHFYRHIAVGLPALSNSLLLVFLFLALALLRRIFCDSHVIVEVSFWAAALRQASLPFSKVD